MTRMLFDCELSSCDVFLLKRPPAAADMPEGSAGRESQSARFIFTLLNLVGQTVRVRTSDGAVYSGLFLTAVRGKGGSVSVCINNVSTLQAPASGPGVEVTDKAMTLMLPASQVLAVEALEAEFGGTVERSRSGGFATDTAISGSARSDASRKRELVEASAWLEGEMDSSLEMTGTRGDWDQFEANQRKFGVKTSYDEHDYTTRINHSKLTQADRARAARLAKDIERGKTTNPHLAEERGQRIADDGLDEEDRYGAVLNTGRASSWRDAAAGARESGSGRHQGAGGARARERDTRGSAAARPQRRSQRSPPHDAPGASNGPPPGFGDSRDGGRYVAPGRRGVTAQSPAAASGASGPEPLAGGGALADGDKSRRLNELQQHGERRQTTAELKRFSRSMESKGVGAAASGDRDERDSGDGTRLSERSSTSGVSGSGSGTAETGVTEGGARPKESAASDASKKKGKPLNPNAVAFTPTFATRASSGAPAAPPAMPAPGGVVGHGGVPGAPFPGPGMVGGFVHPQMAPGFGYLPPHGYPQGPMVPRPFVHGAMPHGAPVSFAAVPISAAAPAAMTGAGAGRGIPVAGGAFGAGPRPGGPPTSHGMFPAPPMQGGQLGVLGGAAVPPGAVMGMPARAIPPSGPRGAGGS